MKHPALRESTVVPKDFAWTLIPAEERVQILDMLVARSKGNFEKIKTWSGTYHIASQEFLSRQFVSAFPLAPPNSGPLMMEREFTVKFALDQNSTLFLDERTIHEATFKPGTREAVTKPRIQSSLRDLFILYKDSYLERTPQEGEVIVGAPGQANAIRRRRRAVKRPVAEGRRFTQRIDPRYYFGRGDSPIWSGAEWQAQVLRGQAGEARRQQMASGLILWRAEGPGGPWYWQTMAVPGHAFSIVWSPQAGYNPVLCFSLSLGKPDDRLGDITEWTWTRFDDTYLPADYKHVGYEDGKNLSNQTHAKLEDCVLNKPLDPQPDMNSWLEIADGDTIWSASEDAVFALQGGKLVPQN
jgi:hypothetical protein